MNNIQDPHHDGLVITLYVANHFVRMILIDGGNSGNIIQLNSNSKEYEYFRLLNHSKILNINRI